MCTFFSYANEHQETLSALLTAWESGFVNYMKGIVQKRMHFVWTKNAYRTDNFEYYSAFIISMSWTCSEMGSKWIHGKSEQMAELVLK